MKIYNYQILNDFEILNDLEDEEFDNTHYSENISEIDYLIEE